MELLTFTSDLLGANMYVLKFGDEAIVIDPCVSIFDAHLDGATVKSVLFTHGHFDHIMAVGAMAKDTGAPVYISAGDMEMMNDAGLNTEYIAEEIYRFLKGEHFFDRKDEG